MARQEHLVKSILVCFTWLFGFEFAVLVAQESPPTSQTAPELRDLNGYFPFTVPDNLDAWKQRKSQLRKHLRVSLGLWPYPERTPLNAVIHGLIDQGDYTIEKVYFESLPGFYVTGNLYKPKQISGTVPGILTPHGHFQEGRFGQQNDDHVQQERKNGAESFDSNARNVIQARCANLARMGCVVFQYDMIGYADSQQISYEVAHRFASQRAEMNDLNRWGLFSPQAELRLQNVMGLQTWNSIRSLDFLETIPGVDSERIGVTGASGGGTQTFIVCAIDDRPAAAFPAVMVSTAMQGGCTCENCCYLRVGTGNVEIAAMFAPKPMGLTSANDWTKEMASKGFPELQELYAMYHQPENIQLTNRTNFGHNYNQVSREAMYRWFKTHLKFDGEPVEREIEVLTRDQLTVFDDVHPRFPGGPDFEKNLLVGLDSPKSRFENQTRDWTINRLLDDPVIRESFATKEGTNDPGALFRAMHSKWDQIPKSVKETVPAENSVLSKIEANTGTYVEMVMNSAIRAGKNAAFIKRKTVRSGFEDISAVQWDFETTGELQHSALRELSGGAGSLARVLLISSDGFSVLESDHAFRPFIKACLESMSVSIFNNGWITDVDKRQSRRVNNTRESLSYTLGYNAPQLARRANAWSRTPEFIANPEHARQAAVYVVALDRAGLEIALNARELRSRAEIAGLVINTQGFRFENITDIRDPDLLPGAVKYGDLPGLLSLAAPMPMLLLGEDQTSASAVFKAYQAAGVSDRLTIIETPQQESSVQQLVLEWIKQRESRN